jgi:hypothetical protein
MRGDVDLPAVFTKQSLNVSVTSITSRAGQVIDRRLISQADPTIYVPIGMDLFVFESEGITF